MARQIHELSAYCNLVIITAHVRQAYEDGETVPQVKEAKFYDRVWQTLDLVGYLLRDNGQGAPKALFAPPHGKARLPAMPESLAPFSWQQVFRHAVKELELPSCQGQVNIAQSGQLQIPQLKCLIDELALLLQLGQLGEDTGFALLPQPVALAADVDGGREMQ